MTSAHEVGVEMGKPCLTPTEAAQIQQWIIDAEAIIAGRYPQGVDPTLKDRAVRTSVARYAAQPKDGATAHEVGVDDARTVRRYSAGSRLSLDDILAAWWPQFDGQKQPGQAFTIAPSYAS